MDLREDYLKWLENKVTISDMQRNRRDKLFNTLFNREYLWRFPMDENRASHGVYLRYLYFVDTGLKYESDDPCSMLEMMVSLAMRMENVMADEVYGNRTPQWFWEMIFAMGLGFASNDAYDETKVNTIIDKFISGDYERDGHGGLFVTDNPAEDFRNVDLWYQAMQHLNDILKNNY